MKTLAPTSDTGLATSLRISVNRLARRLRVERTVPGLGEPALSDTQFAALSALDSHGAMTPGALAGHEKVQPPSMTRVIAALVDSGLVVRAPHPTDRRQVMLTASQSGHELIARARRRRDVWLARRLAELTPAERATLRSAAPILERLSQA